MKLLFMVSESFTLKRLAHGSFYLLGKHRFFFGVCGVLCFFLMSSVGYGQTLVKGHVSDKTTKEDVIGANVLVKNNDSGVSTDLSGNFVLSLTEGVYNLEISAIGYNKYNVEALVVTVDKEVFLEVKMMPNVLELTEVVVRAEGDKSNNNVLLLERKKSSLAVESIGKQELSRKGVSNVAQGLTKLSGITSSSRGLSIRGLGDRYNNAYLNSLPLPSANPDKKVLELDILPSSIVRNISVSKIYNVNQFADVSGASINVFTKDNIEEDYLSLSFGIGLNTRTSFRDFNISKDGDYNYLGISGSGRRSSVPVDVRDFVLRFPADEGNPFNTGFDSEVISAPLDNQWSIDWGKTFDLGQSQLSLIASTSYKNSYRSDEGNNDVLDASQNSNTSFFRVRNSFKTNITNLIGLKYDLNDRHKLTLNYLNVQNSDNNYISSQGRTIDFDNLLRLRNRYLEKRLSVFQAIAENRLLDDRLTVKWGGSVAKAFTDEPDRRDLTFFVETPSSLSGTINRNIAAENGRYFQEIDERENNLFAEFDLDLGRIIGETNSVNPIQFTVGYQFKEKAREVDFRTFTLITDGLNTNNIDLSNLDNLLSNENFTAGRFSYRDINGGERQSKTLRRIHATYGFLEIKPFSKLEIIPGIRFEYTDQTVLFKLLGTPLESPFQSSSINKWEVLPSLNIKYEVGGNDILRAGLSRTLTRPNFNELIPAPQVNENLQSIVGRPTLEDSKVTNVDLKYERFPRSGELFSVGIFYKHIDKPIEQVRSGENFISFFNVASADVYGLEFEFQKRLNTLFSSSLLENLVFDANVSLLLSEVNTNPDEIDDPETQNLLTNVTNTSRQLQGASPFILNFSLGYDKPVFRSSTTSSIKVTYNVFGKKIYNVGTQQRGDEFELPYGTLDLIFKNQFNNNWGVGFSISNILNPSIERQQVGEISRLEDRVTQSYQTGVNFGISVSYVIKTK